MLGSVFGGSAGEAAEVEPRFSAVVGEDFSNGVTRRNKRGKSDRACFTISRGTENGFRPECGGHRTSTRRSEGLRAVGEKAEAEPGRKTLAAWRGAGVALDSARADFPVCARCRLCGSTHTAPPPAFEFLQSPFTCFPRTPAAASGAGFGGGRTAPIKPVCSPLQIPTEIREQPNGAAIYMACESLTRSP